MNTQTLADLKFIIESTVGDRVSTINAYRVRDDGVINLVYRSDSGWQDCEIDAEGGLFRSNPIESRLDSVIYELDAQVHQDSQISLTPPPEVRKAFKKGLEAYEKHGAGDGLEPATVREAKSIAAGKPVTVAKLKKAYRWFARNSRFASYPDGTPAKVSWLLWGGKAFQGWVSQKIKELENAERTDAVRPSCWDCVTKHLSASAVLMEEADRDYPEHKFLAIGHLTQAEEEINDVAPAIAAQIRDIRKEYMRTGESPDYRFFVDLLKQAGIWSANFDSQKCGNSYISTDDMGYGQIMSDRPNLDAFPKFKKAVEDYPGIIEVITNRAIYSGESPSKRMESFKQKLLN